MSEESETFERLLAVCCTESPEDIIDHASRAAAVAANARRCAQLQRPEYLRLAESLLERAREEAGG